MTEDYIHYAWRTRQLPKFLKTHHKNEQVEIVNFGVHNHDAGPDFLNAHIIYLGKSWYGSIEMHINSSDWYHHNHQQDPSYNSVILHVVYENDQPVKYLDGNRIPTIELKGIIDDDYWKYEKFLNSSRFIPCGESVRHFDPQRLQMNYDKWALEKIILRGNQLISASNRPLTSWNEILYRKTLFSLGLKVNAHPFLDLACRIPWALLDSYRNDLHKVESFIFYVSGILPLNSNDKYVLSLYREGEFLAYKHGIRQMEGEVWKFSRMRPSAFPTLKLAFAASMIHKGGIDIRFLLESDMNAIRDNFRIQLSNYWNTHYKFEKPSVFKKKRLGDSLINSIIINAVIPTLFAYGHSRSSNVIKEKVIDLLRQTKVEDNSTLRKMKLLGFSLKNGLDSQALLYLFNELCRPKKCLNCAIGNFILNNGKQNQIIF